MNSLYEIKNDGYRPYFRILLHPGRSLLVPAITTSIISGT
jgi:hypothetical protein